MSDYLIALPDRLRVGIIEHPKRWSGDTHDDLGGSADYDATDTLMEEAADALTALIEARELMLAGFFDDALARIDALGKETQDE